MQCTTKCDLLWQTIKLYLCSVSSRRYHCVKKTRDMSHATCHTQHVTHNMSHTTCHIQHVTHNMSHTTCHIQHVTHNMSHTTCHTQHVTHNNNHVTRKISHSNAITNLLLVITSSLWMEYTRLMLSCCL